MAPMLDQLNSDVEAVQFLKLPEAKTVLWNHQPTEPPSFTLHFSTYQMPKLHIREKLLQSVSKLVESQKDHKVYCKLVGNIKPFGDPEYMGICISLNSFDENEPHVASQSPGYITASVSASRKVLGCSEWSTDYYAADLNALQETCSTMLSMDLSKLMKLRITCAFFGIHCDVKVEMFSFETSFKATSINPISIYPTDLSVFLRESKQHISFTGFVTMDTDKQLVLVKENEPQLPNLPLVGIWVSGVNTISHPIVWAACVRYISSKVYKNRLCLPPLPFLLILYNPEGSKPKFFDCICNEGNFWPTFVYYSECSSATLPKIPIMNTKSLCIDFNQVVVPECIKDVMCQIKQCKLIPNEYVITNTDDIPTLSHSPFDCKVINYNHLVPDLSVFSARDKDEPEKSKRIMASLKFPNQPLIEARTVFTPPSFHNTGFNVLAKTNPESLPSNVQRTMSLRNEDCHSSSTGLRQYEHCQSSSDCKITQFSSSNIPIFPETNSHLRCIQNQQSQAFFNEQLSHDTLRDENVYPQMLPHVFLHRSDSEISMDNSFSSGRSSHHNAVTLSQLSGNRSLPGESLYEELPQSAPVTSSIVPGKIISAVLRQPLAPSPKIVEESSLQPSKENIAKPTKAVVLTKTFVQKSCLKNTRTVTSANNADRQVNAATKSKLLTKDGPIPDPGRKPWTRIPSKTMTLVKKTQNVNVEANNPNSSEKDSVPNEDTAMNGINECHQCRCKQNPGTVDRSKPNRAVFGGMMENVNAFLVNQCQGGRVLHHHSSLPRDKENRHTKGEPPNDAQYKSSTTLPLKRMVSVQQSCILTTQYCEYNNSSDFSSYVNNIAPKYLGKDAKQYSSSRIECAVTKNTEQSFFMPYGMSKRNISSATKQYFKKYGLIRDQTFHRTALSPV